jgi:hypothetical protein
MQVNILAVKPSWMRMDFNSTVGTSLGTIIANDKKFSAISMQFKQFMTGPSHPHNIGQAIQVPLSPLLFVQALFEIEPPGTEWSCTKDKHDLLKECLNSVTSEKITWSNRKGAKRTVGFSQKQYDVEFELSDYQPNVQVKEELTTLDPPKEFQIFRLKKL